VPELATNGATFRRAFARRWDNDDLRGTAEGERSPSAPLQRLHAVVEAEAIARASVCEMVEMLATETLVVRVTVVLDR
jgi:hypothetical protein